MTSAEIGVSDRFRGELLLAKSPGYDDAREIHNERVQGEPAVIARCLGTRDVVEALALARDHDLEISVRGGGHSIGGWSSNDGGLVIDLTLMRWVHIDAESQTAWIGGGTLAGDVLAEGERFGLVAAMGAFPPIGVAGLTMGLGEAYLTPRLGYGADHLLAFELVTADGTVLQIDAENHPDLFWALRGAGANFGVVTALKLRLHPAPDHAVGGSIVFDGADAERITTAVWELMQNGSEYFWPEFIYTRSASGDLQVLMTPGHTGPRELAERELDSFCKAFPPLSDNRRSGSYLDLIFEEPARLRQQWDLLLFPFDGDHRRQIRALLDQARTDGDDHLTGVPITRAGQSPELDDSRRGPGRVLNLWRSVAPSAKSPGVAPRHQGISLVLVTAWTDPACDARELAWVHRVSTELRAAGVVKEAANAMNHVSDADPERAKRVYGTENYERLAQLKALHDPENLFHRNFNIPPAG